MMKMAIVPGMLVRLLRLLHAAGEVEYSMAEVAAVVGEGEDRVAERPSAAEPEELR